MKNNLVAGETFSSRPLLVLSAPGNIAWLFQTCSQKSNIEQTDTYARVTIKNRLIHAPDTLRYYGYDFLEIRGDSTKEVHSRAHLKTLSFNL